MRSGTDTKRNSRWDDTPVRDKHGRPRVAVITDRDVQGILGPLARFRYLPADYLHALGGGSLDYLINRLNLLSRQPNSYVRRPHQQRANAAANYRRLIYELTTKGADVLEQRGFNCERTRTPSTFAHELMTCQIMASFELGARQAAVQLISWMDILNSKSLPEATRRSPKPNAIPISAIGGGCQLEAHVVADAMPFGIRRVEGGQQYYFFCPGVEADCRTEPLETSDLSRSSIYRKFLLYLAVEARSVYRSHFGFPNIYIPFVTTTATRQASMMKVLNRMTDGVGSRSILFTTLRTFTSIEGPCPPSGRMLTDDWHRVGHSPFNFLTS